MNGSAPYTPLHLSLLRAVWPFSAARLAADGAASRLFFALLEASGAGVAPGAEDSPAARALLLAHLPDAVGGDFDSLEPRAAAFYGAAGVAPPHGSSLKARLANASSSSTPSGSWLPARRRMIPPAGSGVAAV